MRSVAPLPASASLLAQRIEGLVVHRIPAIHPGNKTGELTRLYAAQKIEHRLAGFRRFPLRIEVGIPPAFWLHIG